MSGLMPIFWKELTDYLYSKRFLILFILIYGVGLYAIFNVGGLMQSSMTADNSQSVFLRLYVLYPPNSVLPLNFPFLLSLFVPILAIALGFDAVSSERNSGNLSRVLSQPIYRDSVINGKFLAGVVTLTILISSVVAIVGALGLRMIGVPPSSEEVLRLFIFIFITVVYGAFWMALAILFSVLFNRAATSAIASLAIWLFTFFFMGIIAQTIAGGQNSIFQTISMISPSNLYGQATQVILIPDLTNIMLSSAYSSATTPGVLPLTQSLFLVWPQIIALIALAAICFAISYIRFMREEVRST